MNTPRQPNVRPPIERIPGQIRNPEDRSPVPTSFITPFMPGQKPAARDAAPLVTAKDGIPDRSP
jgi:hypothetical protein